MPVYQFFYICNKQGKPGFWSKEKQPKLCDWLTHVICCYGVQKITVAWFLRAGKHGDCSRRGVFNNQAEGMYSRGAQPPSEVPASAAFEPDSDPDLGFKAISYWTVCKGHLSVAAKKQHSPSS